MFDVSMDGSLRGQAAIVAELRRELVRQGAGWSGGSLGGPRHDALSPASEVLAASGALAQVLPAGGLPRGAVVSVISTAPGRSGATSLLLALLAAPAGVWRAVVGMPYLGLLAAAELGVELGRLGIIPDPGPDIWHVLNVLSDGVELIATVSPPVIAPARVRVLAGKLRRQGAVLLVSGHWPGADLELAVTGVRWFGIGQGYGRLRDRELDVRLTARRGGPVSLATLAFRSHSDVVDVTVVSSAEKGEALPVLASSA